MTKVYLDAVKFYEVLSLSENNLATHKEIYSDIRKRVESGIGSTADMSQVEARIAKAHGNLLAAQNNFDTHTQFKRLVGQSPFGLTFLVQTRALFLTLLTVALAKAFNQHPVIKIAQADVDSAKYQYKCPRVLTTRLFLLKPLKPGVMGCRRYRRQQRWVFRYGSFKVQPIQRRCWLRSCWKVPFINSIKQRLPREYLP